MTARTRLRICLAIAMGIVALAGYVVIHRSHVAVNDLLPPGKGFAAIAVALAVAGLGGLAVIAAAGRPARIRRVVAGLVVLVVTGALLLMARGRFHEGRIEAAGTGLPHWPPEADRSFASRVDSLDPDARARWGALIASHLLIDSVIHVPPLHLPADWPFPSDVSIAVRELPGGHAELWARAADGTAHCIPVPWRAEAGDSLRQARECELASAVPPGLTFHRPLREAEVAPQPHATEPHGTWRQYRADASHTASTPSMVASADSGWLAVIDGPVRASAGVAGDLVMLGAHATGAFEVREVANGRRLWATRLPNWVHQDPVTDGRVVAVGFGDNRLSMGGRAPSGVAAYELETGRRLWTAFDETSVMTSAVLDDSILTYASAAGVLRQRHLESGRLVRRVQLPGGVIMAPPAMRNDTLVVTLDDNLVCALRLSTLERLWCTRIPGMRKVGHAAPTLAGDVVLANGLVLLRGMSVGEFLSQSVATQWRLLWTVFSSDAPLAGQRHVALDLATGALRWESRLMPHVREVPGHTSGTAAAAGQVAVTVMPYADTLVAYRVRDGIEQWTAPAHGARGPPLVIDDLVVLTGRDGVIAVHDLASGRLRCTLTVRTGFDRGGPVRAGQLLVMADLAGRVGGVPVSALRDCREEGLPFPVGP